MNPTISRKRTTRISSRCIPDPSSEEAKLVPWVVLPFVRVPSTDLNMTLSIALISFVMIQYIGFKALGIGYLTKFFNFGRSSNRLWAALTWRSACWN